MLEILSRIGRGLLVTAILFPVSTAVFAEESGRKIEEVIVTAERKEASIQDTSISITAFTDQFLDDFGIRNQEDMQNFIPATTIQPYDATIRGVGRNFRALGGDPGVATYMNGIYSEDLLTATAATFFDVERVEVLRGPQGTLYGRNAVGGAINILYKEPTPEFEGVLRAIVGNFGTQEYYGAVSGPLIKDKLLGRVTYAYRERDGVIDEIGGGADLDGLGTNSIAVQFKWLPLDNLEFNIRSNNMKIDRVFGGANGGGLIVQNEERQGERVNWLTPGYRFINTDNLDEDGEILSPDDSRWFDDSQPILNFTNPDTGANDQAQRTRPGVDYYDGNGQQQAVASLDGFNQTSPESLATYNDCTFPGKMKGDDICAGTNGENVEKFDQQGTQFNVVWDVTDTFQLKYLYGYNKLAYQRITDDDNSASLFHDRQFYVNHEAKYTSHELQAFFDIGDSWSFTSGIFFYDATIDQRGDFYSTLNEARMKDMYEDNTALSPEGAVLLATDADGNVDAAEVARTTGMGIAEYAFGTRPMAELYSARDLCGADASASACPFSAYTSQWYGDDGTNAELNVRHGPNTISTDLLYATQTKREAFAVYTQGVWDISSKFALTLGIRYAEDDLKGEENLFAYREGANALTPLYGGLAGVNRTNDGLEDDGFGNVNVPTAKATNGGIPFALSVYRPLERKDTKWTGRINLDWQFSDSSMLYGNVTSGYRSGGFNLVFFSTTGSYEPEELIAYEIGSKSQLFNDTLQLNASVFYYDYESIHTTAIEVSLTGGTTTSVLPAPGAEIWGVELESTWLATDKLTLGGNFSYTPSEYTESFLIGEESNPDVPGSLYPTFSNLVQDIKGNQVLQVPEGKFTLWASYRFPFNNGSGLEVFGVYTWIDDVYYSPFENDADKASSYDRTDLRATWTSPQNRWVVSGYVNNVFDDVGVLQVLRTGEDQFFRHSTGTTVPRAYGMEFTMMMGGY